MIRIILLLVFIFVMGCIFALCARYTGKFYYAVVVVGALLAVPTTLIAASVLQTTIPEDKEFIYVFFWVGLPALFYGGFVVGQKFLLYYKRRKLWGK